MLASLVYLFAAYGIICLLYFNLRDYINLTFNTSAISSVNQTCIILQVKDAEERIEGIVYLCQKFSRSLGISHRLIVHICGSSDQTSEILERLQYRYSELEVDFEGTKTGCRQVVVVIDSNEHPKLALRKLSQAVKQEFSA